MSTDAERVYHAAMQLPDDQRRRLVGRLLESVDPDADPDWEMAWGDEIKHRIEEIDTGKAAMIPWSELRSELMEDRDEPASD
ncbi:MAG TPA: addiction module protein [Pirellulales bacterium]|nr:addiction module protein [Pirellulales bacterium]